MRGVRRKSLQLFHQPSGEQDRADQCRGKRLKPARIRSYQPQKGAVHPEVNQNGEQ